MRTRLLNALQYRPSYNFTQVINKSKLLHFARPSTAAELALRTLKDMSDLRLSRSQNQNDLDHSAEDEDGPKSYKHAYHFGAEDDSDKALRASAAGH